MQTGLVFATPNVTIPILSEHTNTIGKYLDYSQELNLRALRPLPIRSIDRIITLNLDANLVGYIWTINGEIWPSVTPLKVREGERVELILNNKSAVALPVHLHGHMFEVTAIDGQYVQGAVRDTVLVLPHSVVKVQFDANNPGVWLLRAYPPYKLGGLMSTVIEYEGFPLPLFKRKDTGIPISSTKMHHSGSYSFSSSKALVLHN
jgi:hypothetical protein